MYFAICVVPFRLLNARMQFVFHFNSVLFMPLLLLLLLYFLAFFSSSSPKTNHSMNGHFFPTLYFSSSSYSWSSVPFVLAFASPLKITKRCNSVVIMLVVIRWTRIVINVGVHLMFHLVEIKYYKFEPNGNTTVQLDVGKKWAVESQKKNRENYNM